MSMGVSPPPFHGGFSGLPGHLDPRRGGPGGRGHGAPLQRTGPWEGGFAELSPPSHYALSPAGPSGLAGPRDGEADLAGTWLSSALCGADGRTSGPRRPGQGAGEPPRQPFAWGGGDRFPRGAGGGGEAWGRRGRPGRRGWPRGSWWGTNGGCPWASGAARGRPASPPPPGRAGLRCSLRGRSRVCHCRRETVTSGRPRWCPGDSDLQGHS